MARAWNGLYQRRRHAFARMHNTDSLCALRRAEERSFRDCLGLPVNFHRSTKNRNVFRSNNAAGRTNVIFINAGARDALHCVYIHDLRFSSFSFSLSPSLTLPFWKKRLSLPVITWFLSFLNIVVFSLTLVIFSYHISFFWVYKLTAEMTMNGCIAILVISISWPPNYEVGLEEIRLYITLIEYVLSFFARINCRIIWCYRMRSMNRLKTRQSK